MDELPHARVAELPSGARLAYAAYGAAGAPAVLLCRPLGGSMLLWGPFAARLAARLRVIAFDPRGVGRSSDVPPGHSTRSMARDAVALLDVLEVDRAHVFGLSLGGMVATWMAIDSPGRVDRVVLASTPADGFEPSVSGAANAWSLLRCLARPAAKAEACLVRRVLSREFRAAHPARVAELEAIARRAPSKRANLVRLALAAAGHRASPALERITADTLVLTGTLDRLLAGSSRDKLADGLRHATVAVVEHAGHDVTLERPHAVADEVLSFLAGAR